MLSDICDIVSNTLHIYKSCAAIYWCEIEVNCHHGMFISNVDAIKDLIITNNNIIKVKELKHYFSGHLFYKKNILGIIIEE